METPLRNRSTVGRFSLIFVLLLATAAWTFSVSSAQQQAEQGAQQTGANPAPASAVATQQTQSTPPADQTSASQPVESVPAPTEQTLNSGSPAVPQLPDVTTIQPEPASTNCPPEYTALIQKTTASLMASNFAFLPAKPLDPFVPFVSLETTIQPGVADEDEPQNGGPMTPLQKMTLSEIERGLKAITWGALGKKAVIEDSTGRGYIVGVGTPAGEHSGVITQILNDRLVVQQEIWDRKAKKRFPQDFTIKLVKRTDDKVNLMDTSPKQ